MKKALFVSLSVFVSVLSFSQSVNYELPKITSPSPEAQNFLRYGDIPVDMSTGVPSISIPLYTVKSRKLQFPISASYHASGIKVRDRASVIGLGWVLNIRGMLSITTLGGMTFDTTNRPTYKTAAAFNDARDLAGVDESEELSAFMLLLQLEKNERDWQSDRYNFQLPTGLSGIFRYDFITGDLLKLPYGSYKVEKSWGPHPVSQANAVVGFVIIDDKGDRYSFGYPPGGDYNYNHQTMDLLSIISADKTDTIRFIYKTGTGNTYEQATFGSVLEVGDEVIPDLGQPNGPHAYEPHATLSKVTNRVSTSERILDSIVTISTIIKVVSVTDRTDLAWYEGKYRVTKLQVYDRFNGSLTNEVNFNQSYFGTSLNNNLRMRLDSISIQGSTNTTRNTYKFDYDTSVQLPPIPEDDSLLNPLFSEDYWGYFNNSASYSDIPEEFIMDSLFISPYTGDTATIPGGSGTDRNPDHDYAKAAMIKSITYPTGGKTVFEFEPNYASNAYTYIGQPSAGVVGGFRIHQVKNYSDSAKLVQTKTYKYSPGYTRPITSDLFVYDQRIYIEVGLGESTWATAVPHVIYTSQPFLSLAYDHGPMVFYEKVTEYVGDTVNNLGKTEYSYLFPIATIHASAEHPRFQNQYEQDRGSYTPLLSQRIEYRNEGGQYLPVQKTVNNYSTYRDVYYPTGMHMVQTSSYPGGYAFDCFTSSTVFHDTHWSTLGYTYYFKVFDLKATQAVDMMTKSEVTLYGKDTTQQLITTTIIKYDTLTHLQPLEQWVIDSKGDTLKTKYKYPGDYTGTAVYDSMVARNIISPVVEQSGYNNSNFLQSSKTNFYPWSSTFIAPQTVESKTLANDSETRLRFHAYDAKGNTLSVSKENDLKVSYIWDYNNMYPIAQVTNADTGSIAYTSFEGDGKGKWTYSSTPGTDYTAPTGKKIYALNGSNNISKSGLSSGTTYIVSYWTKNTSAYSITGTVSGFPIAGRTVNGWKYFEHRVTGQTTITISGTGTIDELRLYPIKAEMTTYTYEPLVGIKSQSDANNRILYYEYDNFNRLVLIRDQDRNIVKKICYNYAGQPESCAFYSNTDQSWVYYKNDCPPGENAQGTFVLVPAGMFTSSRSVAEANAMALQYAQEQANLNGVCEQMITITATNSAGADCYQVEFYNPSTGFDIWFDVNSGSTTLGNIPPGTYEVGFYSSGWNCSGGSRTYSVGCGNSNTNSSGGYYFYNVTISASCKTVSIN